MIYLTVMPDFKAVLFVVVQSAFGATGITFFVRDCYPVQEDDLSGVPLSEWSLLSVPALPYDSKHRQRDENERGERKIRDCESKKAVLY